MSVQQTFGIARDKNAWTALRLEKVRESGASHGEDSDNSETHDRRGAKPTRRLAYHFETAGHVPHWNGPILNTPFAAQVIGQALNAHEDGPTSARLAYRSTAQIGRAFLFDDNI
jgi:hypothetical protein